MKNFILASASPRRLELLCELGITPAVYPTDADETINEKLSPDKYVMLLSKRKTDAYTKPLEENDILISADTVVAVNDEILGKPRDKEDARRMLNLLSGNTHSVFTALTVSSNKKSVTEYSETKVKFYKLTKKDIDSYIDSNEPMDKAGAYAIQGEAGKFVASYDGEYSNVIGLPKKLLLEILKNHFDTDIQQGAISI